jgi:hypothetical protein
MIELECPGCGHKLRVADKYRALKGKCKYCDARFIVPFDSEPPKLVEHLLNKVERNEAIPVVDPGAHEIGELRYGSRGGRLLAPVLVASVVVLLVFGVVFWWMGQGEIKSTYLEPELIEEIANFETVEVAGVEVPQFGDVGFSEIERIRPSAGPLAEVLAEEVQCFRAIVQGDYLEVASDYQLALTQLGWDFMIYDSGDWMELYGTYDGRDVNLRIRQSTSRVQVVLTVPSL